MEQDNVALIMKNILFLLYILHKDSHKIAERQIQEVK